MTKYHFLIIFASVFSLLTLQCGCVAEISILRPCTSTLPSSNGKQFKLAYSGTDQLPFICNRSSKGLVQAVLYKITEEAKEETQEVIMSLEKLA